MMATGVTDLGADRCRSLPRREATRLRYRAALTQSAQTVPTHQC